MQQSQLRQRTVISLSLSVVYSYWNSKNSMDVAQSAGSAGHRTSGHIKHSAVSTKTRAIYAINNSLRLITPNISRKDLQYNSGCQMHT